MIHTVVYANLHLGSKRDAKVQAKDEVRLKVNIKAVRSCARLVFKGAASSNRKPLGLIRQPHSSYIDSCQRQP